MTNFGNWKGSRASKIILHLVRPLLILKSPRKPTKNILGLGNNKRHVRMNIHTQPVHQLILFLFKDSTLLTLTQTEDLWPQLLVLFSPNAGLSLLGAVDGRPQSRLPSSEMWGRFGNRTCPLLASLHLSPELRTTQNPRASQVDALKPYSQKTKGKSFWNRALVHSDQMSELRTKKTGF